MLTPSCQTATAMKNKPANDTCSAQDGLQRFTKHFAALSEGTLGARLSLCTQAISMHANSLRALRLQTPRHVLLQAKCCSNQQRLLDPVVWPHTEMVRLEKQQCATAAQLIEALQDSVSPERLAKMQQVIAGRTYNVVPVVEGLYDMGNLAAVCRSADAFGFGAVHCIMGGSDKYKRSQRTAAGADKWLDMRLWDDTTSCLSSLKAAGYQVVVTSLTQHSVTIQEVDWSRPTAFVLGNERQGVSDTAVQLADATAIIPMAGFVESFNISVAAALIMYEAQQQRIRKLGSSADLTQQQQQQLLAAFLLRGVKHSTMVATALLNRPPPAHQQKFFKQQTDGEAAAAAAAAEDPVGSRGGARQPGQQSTLAASDSAAPAA